MGIEDREYMKERARERQRAEDQKQSFNGEFNDNKYKGREWSVRSREGRSPHAEDLWHQIEGRGSTAIDFFKHRSGKGVPISVFELIQYAFHIIFVVWVLDRPHLSLEWRLIPIVLMSTLSIYVLRQYKIRTYTS